MATSTKKLTIVRLVGGAGLDSLHFLGLDGVIGQAEEEEERRHREGYGTAASPLERDHHGSVVNVHVDLCSCSYVAAQRSSWWRVEGKIGRLRHDEGLPRD